MVQKWWELGVWVRCCFLGTIVYFFSRLTFLQVFKSKYYCLFFHPPPLHSHCQHHNSNPFSDSLLWDYCISILSRPTLLAAPAPFHPDIGINLNFIKCVKPMVIPTIFGNACLQASHPGSQCFLYICLHPISLALISFISSLQPSLSCSVCCSSHVSCSFLLLLLLILWLFL